ncbi:outer membrane protein OmpU [Sulfitobacter pontiacus]|uniref:Outer membrane protein OmpU n=1 Tax=Sulfitobacter pontiacus TaxID=60137 RepID=A0A1H2ZWC6_9RHOB|nr:porin [Sulfitobacter pontiacus]SDX21685.1 outer membrane protein OmpU [Sulfitobacter pontiacus]
MKKVLFATTALVATAGVAAADVTFGGYGRFGVLYQENASGNDETNVTSRFRLQIDATAESDMGVTFGARARIQQNNSDDSSLSNNDGPDGVAGTADDFAQLSGPAGTGINGVRFFARTGGFEVGVGNIYGALESMPGMYEIDLGLTGLSYEYTAYNFRGDAYSSGGNGAAGSNGVEALYSMGDLKVHISASDTNDRVAGYVAYTFNGFTFAAAAQDSNAAGDTDYALSVVGNVGPAKVSLAYADNGDDNGITGTGGNGDHYALTASFDIGAATNLDVYVADADYFAETSYGIGAHHDLGGGVSLRGGIISRGNDTIRADMGVRFTF